MNLDLEPIDFELSNYKIAENQDEYKTLPAYIDDAKGDCNVISCWQLTWLQRIKLLFVGKLWHMQLTFGSPLQPVVITLENPFRST